MKRIRNSVIGVVLGAGMILGAFAAPAGAEPPPSSGAVERSIVTDSFGILADFDNGFWVFANITREGFCDWVAGGEVGPPPVLTEDFLQVVDTGSAFVVLVKPGRMEPVALHAMIPGPPDPCAGSEPDAWATGEVNVVINDNDAEASLTRTNSFGDHGQGTVYEVATGDAYHYSFNERLQITKDGEFRVVTAKFILKKLGN